MRGGALYLTRRAINFVALGTAILATAFGLFWLAWLLWTLTSNGLAWLDLSVFTQSTPPPGEAGGLANSIVGSVLLTAVGVAVGAPTGVLAGTYLAEFGRHSKLGEAIRFVNDILLSAPSIIIGLVIFYKLIRKAGPGRALTDTLFIWSPVIGNRTRLDL